jgi:hypothetical protein
MPPLEGIAVLAFLSASGVLCAQILDSDVTLVQEAYLKASNTRPPVIVNGASVPQRFGASLAISGDTLVVGAPWESSNAMGVNGDQRSILAPTSGAAYVFVRNGTSWTQQAYLKASNTRANTYFGYSVAISGDTIVVGAGGESSSAKGVNGNQADTRVPNAGAAYVFVRNAGTWSQQAYLKASNTPSSPAPLNTAPGFGESVVIAGDTIAVGAPLERGGSHGVNGIRPRPAPVPEQSMCLCGTEPLGRSRRT